MLNNTIQWRIDFDLPNMHTAWKELIEQENITGKLYVRGFDKFGHAILYLKPRNENTKSHEGNLKHLVYNLEKVPLQILVKRIIISILNLLFST